MQGHAPSHSPPISDVGGATFTQGLVPDPHSSPPLLEFGAATNQGLGPASCLAS